MTKHYHLLALSGALMLASCGDPLDGSDTADMTNDAVTAGSQGTDATMDEPYAPDEDGMLQTDAVEIEENPDMVKPSNETIVNDETEM